MPENKTPEQIEEEETAKAAEADAKLNAVVSSHVKRALKGLEAQLAPLKDLDQRIAAAISAVAPKPTDGEPKPRDASGKFADKESEARFKLLQEQQEKTAKRLQESEDRAKALEEKARKDGVRAQLREGLEAKGIKGARLTALVTHLEATAVKQNEQGETVFVNARSRAKGAPVEPLEFDIAAGIDDWAKTSEAADFLPAPTGGNAGGRGPQGQQQGQGGTRRQAPRYDKPATSDAEMIRRTAEQLQARGVDVNAALDE